MVVCLHRPTVVGFFCCFGGFCVVFVKFLWFRFICVDFLNRIEAGLLFRVLNGFGSLELECYIYF